jgi:hypothetical protein
MPRHLPYGMYPAVDELRVPTTGAARPRLPSARGVAKHPEQQRPRIQFCAECSRLRSMYFSKMHGRVSDPGGTCSFWNASQKILATEEFRIHGRTAEHPLHAPCKPRGI